MGSSSTYIWDSAPSSISSITIPASGTGHINNSSWTLHNDLAPRTLEVQGSAVFKDDVKIDGDLEIRGHSIAETLAKIEQRLAILEPNPKLEEKWAKLKELGDQYRALEADILEKEEIMRILKS